MLVCGHEGVGLTAVARAGYPWRYRHREFIRRYGMFNHFEQLRTPRDTCKDLVDACGLDDGSVQLGKTRVLYRADAHKVTNPEVAVDVFSKRCALCAQVFEVKRAVALQRAALKVQKTFRGFRARTLYRKMKAVYVMLREAMALRGLACARFSSAALSLLPRSLPPSFPPSPSLL